MLLLTEARNSASCGSILVAAASAKSVADPIMKPTVTPVLRARETTRPTVLPHALSLSIAKPLVLLVQPSFTPIFDGVIDEIGDRVEQEVSVAPDKHGPIPDKFEMLALVFRSGFE